MKEQTTLKTELPASHGSFQPPNWTAIIFLFTTLIAAVVLTPIYIYNYGWDWKLLALFGVLYTISNMSITLGYHRMFAHHAFEVPVWMEWVIVVVSALAVQGPITQWATDHRRHHRKVDTPDDPYNINDGLWWAHMGWMLHADAPEYRGNYAPDLLANPRVVWQDRNYWWLATVMSFGLPTLIGACFGAPLGGLIIGGVLRQVLSQHSTFFINSLCHYIGWRPFNDAISARDNTVLAVLTFGEGYHNYHHTFQADYRNGIKWYHWDPTKWAIGILSWLGIAKRLKRVQPQEIFRAQLRVQERRLLQKGVTSERVQQLRAQLEEAFVKFRAMREDYRVKKAELRANFAARVQALRDSARSKRPTPVEEQVSLKEQIAAWQMQYRSERQNLREGLVKARQQYRVASEMWRSQAA